MNTKQALVHAAAALALGWLAAPAHATTTAEGVKCPSGTSARLSNESRKLLCAFEERIERASVCSPVVFQRNGDINLNQRIDMNVAGSDTCRAVSTGAVAPSQALLLPGESASQFEREVRAGADVFVRIKTSYRFPEGGPIYVGDAGRGVVCPSGYDGDPSFNGRGMRCDRREMRVASCDMGWTIDRNNGKDKCFMERIVFGNRVRIDGQYTIPAGSTGVIGNPEGLGWDLRTDHSGNVDYWAKEAKDYRFPVTP
ncbi:MAG: hypothetical protein IT500_11775 [Rubrivivax sp.]|nr:hypothetical protein [Rubrivivax sp.]